MCTRFVYRGNDTITGFNFDIDLTVWDHKIIKRRPLLYPACFGEEKRPFYHGGTQLIFPVIYTDLEYPGTLNMTNSKQTGRLPNTFR